MVAMKKAGKAPAKSPNVEFLMFELENPDRVPYILWKGTAYPCEESHLREGALSMIAEMLGLGEVLP